MERSQDGIYYINQSNYIKKIINETGLEDTKVSNIPLDPGYVKARKDESIMPQCERYQRTIGALLYSAVNSRPDIAAGVTILSQYNKRPTTNDWTEVKRIVRYLKGSKNKKL